METILLADSLRFTVHPRKSVVVPSQSIEFLGFILNSVTMTVAPTQKQAGKVKQQCLDLLNTSKNISIRDVAQLIGSLVAMEPGVLYAPLHYKVLEVDRNKALELSGGSYESSKQLSDLAKSDLHWWVNNIQTSSRPVETGNPDVILKSDGSRLVGEVLIMKGILGDFGPIESESCTSMYWN